MDTTLAINIPIAVYAYDRHKLATDPKAVKRIGFYDKRKVLTETKFQKYYVKATAIASRVAFKDYQELVDKDKEKKDKDRLVNNTFISESENNYLINRKVRAALDSVKYIVYVPVKYYKINAVEATGTMQGVLAFSEREKTWRLFNGSVGRRLHIIYPNVVQQALLYRSYEYDINIVELDRNGDNKIDEKERANAINQNIRKNLSKYFEWLTCEEFEGWENLHVLFAHGVTTTILYNLLLNFSTTVATINVGTIVVSLLKSIKDKLVSIWTYFSNSIS